MIQITLHFLFSFWISHELAATNYALAAKLLTTPLFHWRKIIDSTCSSSASRRQSSTKHWAMNVMPTGDIIYAVITRDIMQQLTSIILMCSFFTMHLFRASDAYKATVAQTESIVLHPSESDKHHTGILKAIRQTDKKRCWRWFFYRWESPPSVYS